MMTLSELVERQELEDMKVERLPNIHRAIAIATDRKGNNFTALQSQPNAWWELVRERNNIYLGQYYLKLYIEKVLIFNLGRDQ